MNKKGFTLVEMLVVIAIIAVLVAIIVPTAIGATTKAAAATNAANLRSYASQMAIAKLTGSTDTVAKPTAKSCGTSFSATGKTAWYTEIGDQAIAYFASAEITDFSGKTRGTDYFDVQFFSELAGEQAASGS